MDPIKANSQRAIYLSRQYEEEVRRDRGNSNQTFYVVNQLQMMLETSLSILCSHRTLLSALN